jgi:hypothetical protein
MKPLILHVLGILALVAAPFAAAAGTCSDQLTAHSTSATPPYIQLPPACRVMGPLHLGMSVPQIITTMGTPDLKLFPIDHHNGTLIYLLPRHLSESLREYPRTEKYVRAHLGFLVLRLNNNKLVSVTSHGHTNYAPIPYNVGDIRIHESIAKLLQHAKTPHVWNATKDNVGFPPYPIRIDVDPVTHRIDGIAIATPRMLFGRWPGFELNKDPSSGLVNGIRVVTAP